MISTNSGVFKFIITYVLCENVCHVASLVFCWTLQRMLVLTVYNKLLVTKKVKLPDSSNIL